MAPALRCQAESALVVAGVRARRHTRLMAFDIQIREIEAEPDLARKALRLAMVVASAFRAIGCETVVVGGSAIEFFTDGDYMSGDVDICFRDRARPELRVIGEVMGRLGAKGSSVRTFQVAGRMAKEWRSE